MRSRIGYQNRPELFARHIVLPEQLYERVIEATERVAASGEVLTPLDSRGCAGAADGLSMPASARSRSCFMHGYRFPAHENRSARLARDIGFPQISASHAVSPLMKLVSRGDTTVVDAYLSPILRRYVDQVAGELGDVAAAVHAVEWRPGRARAFPGKDAILSGPAGGIVGTARTAERGRLR